MGIVIALLALGGTVALAGGLNGTARPADPPNRSDGSTVLPSPGPVQPDRSTPKVAPQLAAFGTHVTAKRSWTARVILAAAGVARRSLRLRIFRNDHVVLEVAAKRGASMLVPGIPLENGLNRITVAYVAAGEEGPRSNEIRVTLDSVARTPSAGIPVAQLNLTRDLFRLHQAPAAFDISLQVTDANGLAVEGASVTFSLSPPGLPTSTYEATTQAGRAAWRGVTLREGLQVGEGFVTAKVTLQDGSTLQRTAHFTVR